MMKRLTSSICVLPARPLLLTCALLVGGAGCVVPLEHTISTELRATPAAPSFLDARASEVEVVCNFGRHAGECDTYARWMRDRVVRAINKALPRGRQEQPGRIRITLVHEDLPNPFYACGCLFWPSLFFIPHTIVAVNTTVELETEGRRLTGSARGECSFSSFITSESDARECAVGRGVAAALNNALMSRPRVLSAGVSP